MHCHYNTIMPLLQSCRTHPANDFQPRRGRCIAVFFIVVLACPRDRHRHRRPPAAVHNTPFKCLIGLIQADCRSPQKEFDELRSTVWQQSQRHHYIKFVIPSLIKASSDYIYGLYNDNVTTLRLLMVVSLFQESQKDSAN